MATDRVYYFGGLEIINDEVGGVPIPALPEDAYDNACGPSSHSSSLQDVVAVLVEWMPSLAWNAVVEVLANVELGKSYVTCTLKNCLMPKSMQLVCCTTNLRNTNSCVPSLTKEQCQRSRLLIKFELGQLLEPVTVLVCCRLDSNICLAQALLLITVAATLLLQFNVRIVSMHYHMHLREVLELELHRLHR